MTLGRAERQGDLLDEVNRFCEQTLPQNSVFAVLHRERDRLFPDEMFADLFSARGRRSVPPSVVATVMVLQRLEGLSDREAVDRYCFDTRWRYAAGVGGYDGDGWGRFAHTVLVDMRARLAASDQPRRIFEVTLAAASAAGLVGARRVLDSTPLYDAVATMDTLTLIRSALRGLLHTAEAELEMQLRGVLVSGDDYASTGKPQIDWDDAQAREQLIDTRARDAHACLLLLDGRELTEPVEQAAQLLASVIGQDLETESGVFRIARRVAKDRSSPPSTRTPGTGTKPPPAASTATRDTSRSIRTARSSPTPSCPPATSVTPPWRRTSSTTCSISTAPAAQSAMRQTTTILSRSASRLVTMSSAATGRSALRSRRFTATRLTAAGVFGPAGRREHRLGLQDPTSDSRRWAVRQGPVRHRPQGRHRDLPGAGDRADPARPRRRRHRLLRRRVRHLPAARALHHRHQRTHGQCRPS
jgi:hypothetical protein